MPLYDIVSESFKTFSVFEHCRSEESALVKLLECVKQFENTGNNSLKDFLTFSDEPGATVGAFRCRGMSTPSGS
jgi:hypothetical protein